MGRLIKYLQAMRGQQLWPYEQVSLTRARVPSANALRALVTSLVISLDTSSLQKSQKCSVYYCTRFTITP